MSKPKLMKSGESWSVIPGEPLDPTLRFSTFPEACAYAKLIAPQKCDDHFTDDYKCFAATDERITENGPGYTETCGEWRLRQYRKADSHIETWKESDAYKTRPFRFEDLYGGPEPKRWGPLYPTLAGVEKWRKLDRKRELTNEETHAYGAAVGEAIRRLNRPPKSGPISLKCTVQNTCGVDCSAEGEEKRYRHWVDVRLPAMRAERLALMEVKEATKEVFWAELREAA